MKAVCCRTTELTADKIAPAVITELCRYHPSEVLLNPGLLDCREVTAYIKKNMNCSVELVEDERYAPGLVASALEEQFGRDWPQTTGCWNICTIPRSRAWSG